MIYLLPTKLIQQTILNQKGFGLLSMVFVILTLSIATVTVMTLINPSTLTKQNLDTAQKAKVLRAAIQSYEFSHGGVSGTKPATLDALVVNAGTCAMDNDPTSTTYLFLQGWCGPYMDQVFQENISDFKKDGWGTDFSYNAGTSVLTSCGPDRSCGGADDLTFAP